MDTREPNYRAGSSGRIRGRNEINTLSPGSATSVANGPKPKKAKGHLIEVALRL